MTRLGGFRCWSLLVGFEPRDLWVGVYWDHRKPRGFVYDVLDIYVCVLPTLVVRFCRERSVYDVADPSQGREEQS